MPPDPTLTDVIQQITDLHSCQELNAQHTRKGLADAADARAELADQIRDLDKKVDDGWRKFNSTGWKLVGSIGGIMLAAVLATVANNIIFTSNVATKADVTAHTALRYTSADAARDRAEQDARDQAILDEIAALKKTQR